MKSNFISGLSFATSILLASSSVAQMTYPIVSTGVTTHYGNNGVISAPGSSDAFYGQDADFQGTAASYTDNGDGTITDNVTNLMWQGSPDANGDENGQIEAADKLTWAEVQARVATLNSTNYLGHSDWRIPTIKELYSLSNWTGTDPSSVPNNSTTGVVPFIDNSVFPFAWGETPAERLIDAQYASINLYNDQDCDGFDLLFGMNFADGRIKGYGTVFEPQSGVFVDKTFSLICVRNTGSSSYGVNSFSDNSDGTVSDIATGLMWDKDDNGAGLDWEDALAYAQTQNAANYKGHSDWRVPNIKELQSIVDYSRSPVLTSSAAIDPIFNISSITNEGGNVDWPFFWSSTTHLSYNGTDYGYNKGAYIPFGVGSGWWEVGSNAYFSYCDVHGAGCQRSDPKSGTWYGDNLGVDSGGNTVYGSGPQGDIVRVLNHVRLVRTETAYNSIDENQSLNLDLFPNPVNDQLNVRSEERISRVTVFNSFGQKVIEQDANALTVEITTKSLSPGIYFVNVLTESEITAIEKIVIQ